MRDRLSNRAGDAVGDIGDIEVGNHDDKFVTPLACNGVTGPDTTDKPLGGNFEQFVADIVPQAVIDELEIVQIHEKNRHVVAVPLRHEQRLVNTVDEDVTVGEEGEAVMAGLVLKLFFIAFTLGNILKGFNYGQQFPPAVAYRRRIEGKITINAIQIVIPPLGLQPFGDETGFSKLLIIVRHYFRGAVDNNLSQDRGLCTVERLPGFIAAKHFLCLDAG